MKKHFNLKISGRVQGVFFRASTREKANEMGVQGFVRNEPDGSVYLEVEGEEDAVQQFINWCHEGPSAARVDKVDQETGDVKNFQGFVVK